MCTGCWDLFGAPLVNMFSPFSHEETVAKQGSRRDAPVLPEEKEADPSSSSSREKSTAAPAAPEEQKINIDDRVESKLSPKKKPESPGATNSAKVKDKAVHSAFCTLPCGIKVSGWWGGGYMDLSSWLQMAKLNQKQLNDLADHTQAAEGAVGCGVLIFTHHRDQGMLRYHAGEEYEEWDKLSAWPEGGIEVLQFAC